MRKGNCDPKGPEKTNFSFGENLPEKVGPENQRGENKIPSLAKFLKACLGLRARIFGKENLEAEILEGEILEGEILEEKFGPPFHRAPSQEPTNSAKSSPNRTEGPRMAEYQ